MSVQPTQVSPTSQQSSRAYIVDHIVLHHCATTDFDGVVAMMQSGSRQVSANYVVKDGRIAAVVPENMRSWSLSSALWDGRSITFEICNESTGGSWPVSAASHETVARMCADICTRYGIPVNRDRILGHREVYTRYGESYATACPGGLDLDRIVQRAQQILQGGSSEGDEDMAEQFTEITTDGAKAATGVGKGTWVMRAHGGGPLLVLLTQAHALMALEAAGYWTAATGFLPAHKGRVFHETGEWLLAAIAEDNSAQKINAKMHPYMAAPAGGGTVDVDVDLLAAKIAPLVKAPEINYAALAKAVNDDASRRLSA